MIYHVVKLTDWDTVAKALAKTLKPGMIVGLSGPLGAGKTTFVQALARELGIRNLPKSPTFSLVRTYRLPSTVYRLTSLVHVDAYRIEKPEDVLTLGLEDELSQPGTLLMIEWPENIAAWLAKNAAHYLALRIELQADGSRVISW